MNDMGLGTGLPLDQIVAVRPQWACIHTEICEGPDGRHRGFNKRKRTNNSYTNRKALIDGMQFCGAPATSAPQK
jgi:hypothetical protein